MSKSLSTCETNFQFLLSVSLSTILFVCYIFLSTHITYASDRFEIASQNDAQWLMPRKDYANTGFSNLRQIDQNNINHLKLAWTFSTGVNRGHEGSPLVVGDIMYVHTPFPNNIYALDLNHNQKILWSYFPRQSPDIQALLCCDTVSRGLGYADNKIFLQQNNGELVALDAKTGHVVWSTSVNDPKIGATNTNAPHVFKDKVLTGCSGGEFGVRCFIAAYNIKDGALAWKAYSTGSDSETFIGQNFNQANPHYSALASYQDVNGGNQENGSFKALNKAQLEFPVENLGVRTWLKKQAAEDGWQHGGGPVWGWFSYDPKLNLVYYGTGNPSVWNPDVRPGDNKWAMTIFARDLDTGIAKWGYQMTPHDEWDYDGINEIILWNTHGKKLATHFDRNGFAYTFNRLNGSLIVANKMHPFVNWATSIDLKTGIPQKVAQYSTHEDVTTKHICPAAIGGKNIQPAAYSPKTHLFYVPLNHLCMDYDVVEAKYVSGQPWVGAGIHMYAGPDGVTGGFMAWDGLNGKQAWYNKEKYAVWSGALATSANLVFYGTLDRWFKAIDANSGKQLWKFQVGSGVIGNPFTYSHHGKQYVGIYSGIGGWAGIAINQGLTEDSDGAGAAGAFRELTHWNAAPGSGMLNVFSL